MGLGFYIRDFLLCLMGPLERTAPGWPIATLQAINQLT